jgi:hypothetical protein
VSESLYKFEIADKDLAFSKGLPTSWEVDGLGDIGFAVKVKAGEPYILHVGSDHVLTIINPQDRWAYEHLYAVHTTAIGGGNGVYADNDEEALDIFADYCAEQVPDLKNEGQTKMRWPGLVQTWVDIVEEVGKEAFEQYSGDYPGPYGNEGWYFTERGSGHMTEKVYDPKIPPIPDDLFPYIYEAEKSEPVKESIETAFWYLRKHIGIVYGNQEWSGWLEDYVYDNREKLFVASVIEHEEPELVIVSISVAE